MVKGLGETLVGAYPGRALSFVSKKNNMNSPQVRNLAFIHIRDWCQNGYSYHIQFSKEYKLRVTSFLGTF